MSRLRRPRRPHPIPRIGRPRTGPFPHYRLLRRILHTFVLVRSSPVREPARADSLPEKIPRPTRRGILGSHPHLRIPPKQRTTFCPSFLQGSLGYGRVLPYCALLIHLGLRACGHRLSSRPLHSSVPYHDRRLDHRDSTQKKGNLATG